MAKFDFNNSGYARLWGSEEGTKLMQFILNDPNMINSNITFWKEKFLVDPAITPTDHKGLATFRSEMREITAAEMMDWRAPLADTRVEDKADVAFYTGAIIDFSTVGYKETAAERLYKEKMFEQFGNDSLIVKQYAEEIQKKIDSRDQTLSHLGAQLMSAGKIIYKGGVGNKGAVYKADIPAENFIKAGEKVWSAADCLLLTQMKEIEKSFRDKWGIDAPFQWEVTKNTFDNVVLKNKEVVDFIVQCRVLDNQVTTDGMTINREMFYEHISKFDGLSPIVIIEEKQRDKGTTVHGWDDKIAVWRPAGPAGMIRHTEILDSIVYPKYGAKSISRVFTPMPDGLGVFVNTTLDNGGLQEWHTDFLVSAMPSLDEFLYHVICDITQAGTGPIGG